MRAGKWSRAEEDYATVRAGKQTFKAASSFDATRQEGARPEHRTFGDVRAPDSTATTTQANVVIDLFCAGTLPGCKSGESLRKVLARTLMCKRMRITKKFSATSVKTDPARRNAYHTSGAVQRPSIAASFFSRDA